MNELIRTMDQMDKYLAKDGVTVTRRYQAEHKRYKFTLKKDNFEKEYFFYYPTDCTDSARYERMTNAAKGMLEDFNKGYAIRPFAVRKRNDGLLAFAYASMHPAMDISRDISEMYPSTMIVHKPLAPTNVIFSGPATIVFWNDGTKTVVKCSDGDEYDPEKGLAMAYSKKLFGNKGNYCKQFKKWLPKEEEKVESVYPPMSPICAEMIAALNKACAGAAKKGRGGQ